MTKEHIGSNFDDWLKEEGILEEVDFVNNFAITLTNTNIYERKEIGKKIFKQLQRLKAENEQLKKKNTILECVTEPQRQEIEKYHDKALKFKQALEKIKVIALDIIENDCYENSDTKAKKIIDKINEVLK